jgi:pantetheine-phosphate adenylyltransferase
MNEKPIKIAVYPGTFDPLTLGHFDVITRASKLFDKLIVTIGINAGKAPFFSIDQRIEMTRQVCAPLGNVTVDSFSGLAVKFASAVAGIAIVRGLRTEADFMYEMQMAMMNRKLESNLETVFIPTRQDLSHVSSSLVKEIFLLGGDITGLVPPLVIKALTQQRRKQDSDS